MSIDKFALSAGGYVHIPFCGTICPYCDFAVVAGRDDQTSRYGSAVIAEIGRDLPWRPLDSVYFGGGTPSRMPPPLLEDIVAELGRIHGIKPDAEISLEANPEDFDGSVARSLKEAGFNRISFGAQSFDDRVLIQLGRRHGPGDIGVAVERARSAGFENVSLDLIYGTPGETGRSWTSTLEEALLTAPDHVSCYALTAEPGTPLGRQVRDGAPAPDPDIQAERFEAADRILGEAGLARYEVSNWSRPGMECVYNSVVWAQGEFVAYGNGAHRYRDGVRSWNLRLLDKYLAAVEEGRSPVAGSDPRLEGPSLEIDRLFVGLRRRIGCEAGPGGDALLNSSDGRRLVEANVISAADGWLRVEKPLFTDEVLRSVLVLQDEIGGALRVVESGDIPDNVVSDA